MLKHMGKGLNMFKNMSKKYKQSGCETCHLSLFDSLHVQGKAQIDWSIRDLQYCPCAPQRGTWIVDPRQMETNIFGWNNIYLKDLFDPEYLPHFLGGNSFLRWQSFEARSWGGAASDAEQKQRSEGKEIVFLVWKL